MSHAALSATPPRAAESGVSQVEPDSVLSHSTNKAAVADPGAIIEAIRALRAGELVVYPTETFYALGADPLSETALARLFDLKGREAGKAIALIAADAASAFSLAREIPPMARRLANLFWPGPLTLVVPARTGLPASLIGPDGGIGVRVSPNLIARALASGLGHPVTATSANLSGHPAAVMIGEVRAAFGEKVKVYLDGGTLAGGAPSTLVGFEPAGFRVIRAGAVSEGEIAAALGAGRRE